jgi:hypothetical protein
MVFTCAQLPGTESERRREQSQMGGSDLPESLQNAIDLQPLGEGTESWLAVDEKRRNESLEQNQCSVDGLHAPAYPPQHPRQLDVQAQIGTRCLQTLRLFGGTDHRFDLGQGAGQTRSQTVRQQTEGATPARAIPTGDAGSGRGETLIGAVAGKSAPAIGVQRTPRQACSAPGLLVNVLLAGEVTLKAKLHRPQARTGATVAGLSLPTSSGILPHFPPLRLPVMQLENQTPSAHHTEPPTRLDQWWNSLLQTGR